MDPRDRDELARPAGALPMLADVRRVLRPLRERDGTWARLHRALLRTPRSAHSGVDFDLFCLDSTIVRAHKAAAPRARGKNRAATQRGEPADHALGRSRGGFSTKLSLFTDGAGLPLAAYVHAGQASDLEPVPTLLDSIAIPGRHGAPRRYPEALAGDKSYSCAPVRRWCRPHRVTAVLPRRRDQRPVKGRRFDRARYRQRHAIEATVEHLKEFRRIAQRADKLARRYRAFVLLGMVRLILRRPFRKTA